MSFSCDILNVVGVSGLTGITVGNTGSGQAINVNSGVFTVDHSGNVTAGTITGTLNGDATNVTGVVAVVNGGTNSSTALNNNRIMVSSGGEIVESAALSNGQLLIGSTSAAPVIATITGTTDQISVTNGAGSITLSTPQNIDSTASPSFAGLTLSGLTASDLVATNGSKVFVSMAYSSGNSANSIAQRDSSGNIIATAIELAAATNQIITSYGGSHTGTISVTAPAATQVYIVPDPGASCNFIMSSGTQTMGGTYTITNAPTISALTASEIVVTNASKVLASLAYDQGASDSTIAQRDVTGALYATVLKANNSSNQIVANYSSGHTIVVDLALVAASSQTYTVPDPGASCNFIMSAGTQTVAGSTTFSSGINITPTTNQIVLGTTNTTTISATAPAASRIYTIPDAGANASFILSSGNGNATSTDFQNGVWTPTVTGGINATIGSISGIYLRVGNSVFCTCNCNGSSISGAEFSFDISVPPTLPTPPFLTSTNCNGTVTGSTSSTNLASGYIVGNNTVVAVNMTANVSSGSFAFGLSFSYRLV